MDDDIDPFEISRRLPSHQQRLAEEKRVNIYFVPGTDKNGNAHYAYIASSALLHTQFMDIIRTGLIPDFAVVVEEGSGMPPEEEIREKMLKLYGFESEDEKPQG